MKHLLLSGCLLAAISMFAEAPQTAFNLIGFNGEASASETNLLEYVPGDADDEEEGMYRYINEDFQIESCASGFMVVGAEGLKLGFDSDNELGYTNEVTELSAVAPLAENGPAVNCTFPAGSYKVIMASMQEEGEPMSWTIMFHKNSGEDEKEAYYLLGFEGETEASQSTMFLEQKIDDTVIYTYPKFLVGDCPEGFWVINSAEDTILGVGDGDTGVSDDAPFAILTAGGAKVPSELTPGYYSVNLIVSSAMNMISFTRCEDQTPNDECDYYLLGFNGINEPAESVRFSRSVSELEDEDEIIEVISYTLKDFEIKFCSEDGFKVSNKDGDAYFGLYYDMAALMGDIVTEDSPFAMLGIYGTPLKSALPAGKYDITFSAGETYGSIAFIVSGDDAVEGIESDDNTPEKFYDLQGSRIAEPADDIYIRVKGSKVEKIIRRR